MVSLGGPQRNENGVQKKGTSGNARTVAQIAARSVMCADRQFGREADGGQFFPAYNFAEFFMVGAALTERSDQALVHDSADLLRQCKGRRSFAFGRHQRAKTLERLERSVGVDGGNNGVAGFGGAERSFNRVGVAHLPDDDVVGIVTHRGADQVGEFAAMHAGANLPLRGIAQFVFDRVFNRQNVFAAAVDLLHAGIKRCCLTGTCRAGEKDQTPAPFDFRRQKVRKIIAHIRMAAEQFVKAFQRGAVEQTKRDFFAVLCLRPCGHTDVDGAALPCKSETSVFGGYAIAEVQTGIAFQKRCQTRHGVGRQKVHRDKITIDTVFDPVRRVRRSVLHQVNIGGAHLQGFRQHVSLKLVEQKAVVGIGEPKRQCFFAAVGGQIVHRAQRFQQFRTVPHFDFDLVNAEAGTVRCGNESVDLAIVQFIQRRDFQNAFAQADQVDGEWKPCLNRKDGAKLVARGAVADALLFQFRLRGGAGHVEKLFRRARYTLFDEHGAFALNHIEITFAALDRTCAAAVRPSAVYSTGRGCISLASIGAFA